MQPHAFETMSKHVADHIGPIAHVLHELLPTDPHIDLHVVAPSGDRPFYSIVTSGMSESPMPLPAGVSPDQATPYVELYLSLPPDWDVHSNEPKWFWPMCWLRFLAAYPHQFGTFIYVGHTIPNAVDSPDETPQPFDPSTDFCCWFLDIGRTVPEGFHEVTWRPKRGKDRTVLFIALYPIYLSEMRFAIEGDDPARPQLLSQKLTLAGVSELLNPQRDPVA